MSRATAEQSAAIRALLDGDAIEQAFELAETLELTHLDLRGMVLESIDYEKTPTMRGADLRGATIDASWLDGLDLREADLRGLHFVDEELIDIDFRGAKLEGTRLWDISLDRSNLSGVDLTGVDGIWGSLQGCDLRGADLCGVDLSSCDLRDADLRGARLDGTDLTGVWISERTRLDPGVHLPSPLRGPTGPDPAPLPAALGWTPPVLPRDEEWDALAALLAVTPPALAEAALPGLLWALRTWTPYQTSLELKRGTPICAAQLALADYLIVSDDVPLEPLLAVFPTAHRLIRLEAPAALVQAVLPRCPSLRELTVHVSTNAEAEALARAPALAQLRDLTLRGSTSCTGNHDIMGAPQLRRLMRLDAGRLSRLRRQGNLSSLRHIGSLQDSATACIAAATQLTRLVSVDLQYCSASADVAGELAQLLGAPHIAGVRELLLFDEQWDALRADPALLSGLRPELAAKMRAHLSAG